MKSKISLTLPVYNEEAVIEDSVKKVREFLNMNLGDTYEWKIVIADNGSTDATPVKAKSLSDKYADIRYTHIDEKGRGRALRDVWSETNADIFCYMDIDLSTDLDAFPRLIDKIAEGYDIVIGSRFIKGASVNRSFKRELLSKGYNALLKLFLGVKFSDAQCGFKAVNKRVVDKILPEIKDQEWFFDTELLVRAERKGFKIAEIPVKWIEDTGSSVKLFRTISVYVKSIIRLMLE